MRSARKLRDTSNPFRVLQVVNTLARVDGGPARNAYELHRTLNASGDCIAAMVVMHRTPWKHTVASEPEPAGSEVNGGQLSEEISLLRLFRLMKNADAVILHGYYLPWVPIMALASHSLATPVFLTPHGSLTRYQRQFSRIKKTLFDNSVGFALRRSIRAFMVGSQAEADDLIRYANRVPAIVVGVGTPIRPLQTPSPRQAATEEIQLLSVSRIAPKKRIDLMIETVNALKQRGLLAVLTVAGTGPQELISELQEAAEAVGLTEQIIFAGEVAGKGKDELYAAADIFIAPSDDENFGISVAEALGHGLACVASEHVASAVGLKAPAGIVVRDRTGNGLADAVLQLLEQPVEARRQASHAFAADRYAWTAVATRWINAMREIDTQIPRPVSGP